MVLTQRWQDTKRTWRREITPYLAFCTIAFAFGDLLFGVDTGSFGSIQALPSFLSDFAPVGANGKHAFPTKTKSIMNSVVWPGKLLGTIVFEPLLNRVGYKKSMYVVALAQTVGLIIELTAHSWQTFSGGRIICYFATGIAENVVPAYVSEVTPAGLRGFFAGIMNVIVALGNLWGSGMGRAYATETRKIGWLVPVAVQFIPVVAIALMIPFTPESPRWLVLKGRRDAAVDAMNRLRPQHDVDSGLTVAEVDALNRAVQEGDASSQGSWLDLFRGNYPRRTTIACLMFYCNQCCGNQFINLYGPTFYTQIGLSTKAFTYTTMSTAVGIAAAIVALLFVDYFGRRTLLMAGITLALVFNAVTGGVGSKKGLSQTDINTIVASLVFVVIGNKFSVNPLCYVVAAELGGVKMRKKIMAVATAADVCFAFAMSYGIPYLIGTPGANLGAKVGFFFMGTCALALIFVVFFVPECTGRSLEEVDELFDRNVPAWRWESVITTGIGKEIRGLEQGRLEKLDSVGGIDEESKADRRHTESA